MKQGGFSLGDYDSGPRTGSFNASVPNRQVGKLLRRPAVGVSLCRAPHAHSRLYLARPADTIKAGREQSADQMMSAVGYSTHATLCSALPTPSSCHSSLAAGSWCCSFDSIAAKRSARTSGTATPFLRCRPPPAMACCMFQDVVRLWLYGRFRPQPFTGLYQYLVLRIRQALQ